MKAEAAQRRVKELSRQCSREGNETNEVESGGKDRHDNNKASDSSVPCLCPFSRVEPRREAIVEMAARDEVVGGASSARRRRERRLRAWHRHIRRTVAMELAVALHHSAQRPDDNDGGAAGGNGCSSLMSGKRELRRERDLGSWGLSLVSPWCSWGQREDHRNNGSSGCS